MEVAVVILLGSLASAAWLGLLWPEVIPTTTTTTTTSTTLTSTSSTRTVTSTSTRTTTSTPLPSSFKPIYGGQRAKNTSLAWLHVWRSAYQDNDGILPELSDASLPSVFKGIGTKVVISSGGAAGGVVSEGMGYAMMLEGIRAAAGDKDAVKNGLALWRGWLGMVYGPSSKPHPFGGGSTNKSSSTNVRSWPYGVSAIEAKGEGLGPSGMATWKYPLDLCKDAEGGCTGAAADADQDAVMGMIYLTAVLEYPDELVDMTVRAVISFASADLGFPDLHRTLPDGAKVFVPKCGSAWGGLLPPHGSWHTAQAAWCYSPGYFAPGHYRLLRDFAAAVWRPSFDAYLPPHLDGTPTSLAGLIEAFNGAVTAGYNIMYRSSCASGAISNWVGVKAPCKNDSTLSCPGVPWATTPYVGLNGTCNQSGTKFGSWGPDASRTMWRVAMDYALYTAEAMDVPMYDESGHLDKDLVFNAKTYLNRIARQYKRHSKCDGSIVGACLTADTHSPWQMAFAFDKGHGGTASDLRARDLTCHNVPNAPETWWSHFMSYPTFTALIAPFGGLSRQQSENWIESFMLICNFTDGKPKGDICATTYFEASQEAIATMIISGGLVRPPKAPPRPLQQSSTAAPPTPSPPPKVEQEDVLVEENHDEVPGTRPWIALAVALTVAALAAAAATAADALGLCRLNSVGEEVRTVDGKALSTEPDSPTSKAPLTSTP